MIDGLARALHRAGHDVLLIALEGSTCPVPLRTIAPGSQEHSFSGVCHEVSYALAAYSDLDGFDVVHDHTMVGPAYSRVFSEVPIVVTNHGPFEGVLNEIYAREAPWVSQFVGISHSQVKTATVPTSVIHHGVDPRLFALGDGAGDARGEYLLFLARMQPIKGAHIAAKVARAARKRLVIAAKMAEPAEIEYFHREVEPLLGDGIEFVGEVGGAEKVALLRNASALLNPIRWPEPFGLTMTEALACGTPVMAFDEGAVPEIVGHGRTGFVCADEDEMVAAIGMLGAIDRADCRAAVENYFNVDRMASDYVAVYERAIAHHQEFGKADLLRV
jgi:glycosyltransferase involved in cell wall biosynthesis